MVFSWLYTEVVSYLFGNFERFKTFSVGSAAATCFGFGLGAAATQKTACDDKLGPVSFHIPVRLPVWLQTSCFRIRAARLIYGTSWGIEHFVAGLGEVKELKLDGFGYWGFGGFS